MMCSRVDIEGYVRRHRPIICRPRLLLWGIQRERELRKRLFITC